MPLKANSNLSPSPFNLKIALENAKGEVYRRFPELKGVEPKYLVRRIKNRPVVSRYLIFRHTLTANGGEPHIQIVRVYLSPQGEIARLIVSKG